MYISGQVGVDPTTKKMVPGGVQAETRMALQRMGQLLKEANCDYNNGKSDSPHFSNENIAAKCIHIFSGEMHRLIEWYKQLPSHEWRVQRV